MARTTSASAVGLALAALLAGCSYSVFNDLEDRAPAARVTQESSDISSASFGDQLVGLPRGGNAGGLVVITGNADPAFSSATISGSGGVSAAHLEADDVKSELANPDRINAAAAVPSSVTAAGAQGPFLYLGSVSLGLGTVRVMDAVTMRHVQAYDAPTQPQAVTSFGLSLAAARLGEGALPDDVAVGAKDAVVLLRAASGGTLSWPYMQTDQAVVVAGGTDWPSGDFSVIASGDLDPSTDEDEIVAAVPEKNAVVVVHHVADCFASAATQTCTTHLVIPIPSGASLFGSALLVGDVDDDGAPELVVGAPDVNRVYVYDLGAEHFDLQSPSAPPAPTTITPPTGAREFGAALALGRVDGGAKPLLAVGAPGTEVSGAATAGRLYLFGSDLKAVGEGVELATPEEKTLLGRRLAVVPFVPSDGGSTYELLAASGRDAVFIFFANLTPAHKDVRK